MLNAGLEDKNGHFYTLKKDRHEQESQISSIFVVHVFYYFSTDASGLICDAKQWRQQKETYKQAAARTATKHRL